MNRTTITLGSIALATFLIACGGPSSESSNGTVSDAANEIKTSASHGTHDAKDHVHVKDTHSFSEPEKIASTHIALDLTADFENKTLSGTATHTLEHRAAAEKVVFDLEGMKVTAVTLDGDVPAKYERKTGDSHGDALHVMVKPETKKVTITYTTNPGANAVQWLSPQQTTGKEYPFLFTQGQAILTRSWIPCQDSPGVRVTYDAKMTVPKDLMAVMSASNPTEKSSDGVYDFEMKQAIPPYLIALAIGDLEFRKLGAQTGVYAEPQVIEKGAAELEDMQSMVEAAEGLYGKYRWDQYDVIFLPASFPFGGMENPRLTFATPTILAGDKSLTSLIAHELAHSWSGNLVTNATWDDFWLNEGFTVYFEYRIMEEVYGKDYTDMVKTLGAQDLVSTVEGMKAENKLADTHLKLDLDGRDPDDGMTDIAYEKGHMFLEMLENTFGREKFDAFLKGYFDEFAFQNMTTDRFLTYLDTELIAPSGKTVNVDEWVYGPGLPANMPVISSDRFAKVDTEMKAFKESGKMPAAATTGEWSTHEWLHFLRAIPADMSTDKMATLDKEYALSASTNAEIQGIWYIKAAEAGYEPAFGEMEAFLINVGRRKFLTPIYTALKDNGRIDLAKSIYTKARPNYHSVARGTMDGLLGVEG